jgi:hypothetical protein
VSRRKSSSLMLVTQISQLWPASSMHAVCVQKKTLLRDSRIHSRMKEDMVKWDRTALKFGSLECVTSAVSSSPFFH